MTRTFIWQLNKLNSLCQLQSYRNISEHNYNVELATKPFGYDARENVIRGIPRS